MLCFPTYLNIGGHTFNRHGKIPIRVTSITTMHITMVKIISVKFSADNGQAEGTGGNTKILRGNLKGQFTNIIQNWHGFPGPSQAPGSALLFVFNSSLYPRKKRDKSAKMIKGNACIKYSLSHSNGNGPDSPKSLKW